MSIKLGFIKKYYNVVNTLREEIEEQKPDYDLLYHNVNKFIISNSIKEPTFQKLADYMYFIVLVNDKQDIKKDIRKLFRNNHIELHDYIITIKEIFSKLITYSYDVANSGDIENSGTLNIDDLEYASSIVTFNLFLIYCIDFGFKVEFNIGGSRYNNILLNDTKKLLGMINKDAKALLGLTITELAPLHQRHMVDVNSTIKNMNVGEEVSITYKLETLVLDGFMKELLSDIWIYYKANVKPENTLVLRIISEMRDKEYYDVLVPEFLELLRKRDFLLPYNGLNVISEKINMDVYERQYKGTNYIVAVCTYHKDFSSGLINTVTVLNLNNGTVYNTGSTLYDICNLLFYMYGLDKKCDELYRLDPRFYISVAPLHMLNNGVLTVKGTANEYKEYEIRLPSYWKYRGSSTSGSHNPFKQSLEYGDKKEQYISAFKRRLRKGAKASKEAKELSEFYCIELENGETLVQPFIRNKKEI